MTFEEYIESQSPATRAQIRDNITLYRCRMIWNAGYKAGLERAAEIADEYYDCSDKIRWEIEK